MNEARYKVAALYKFVLVSEPTRLRDELTRLCIENSILGTLIIAKEGINGTIAGLEEDMQRFLEARLLSDPDFSDGLEIKYSYALGLASPFYRLRITVKNEIVTMGLPDLDIASLRGIQVEPKDWNKLLTDPSVTVLDTRNRYVLIYLQCKQQRTPFSFDEWDTHSYEVDIGTFENALNPKTEIFKEFPSFVQKNLDPKIHKKIAMFCTGGIRCEKAAAHMKLQGFEQVYSLTGGILRYMETVDEADSLYRGECFVFDKRVSVLHGLQQGTCEFCRGCRKPLTQTDLARPEYSPGVCCHHCKGAKTSMLAAADLAEQQQQDSDSARGRESPSPVARATRDPALSPSYQEQVQEWRRADPCARSGKCVNELLHPSTSGGGCAVSVRIRPVLAHERSRLGKPVAGRRKGAYELPEFECVSACGDRVALHVEEAVRGAPTGAVLTSSYAFRPGGVFGPDSSEERLFAETVRPVLAELLTPPASASASATPAVSAAPASSACIILYGQTSSGKTHTATAMARLAAQQILSTRRGGDGGGEVGGEKGGGEGGGRGRPGPALIVSAVEIAHDRVLDLLSASDGCYDDDDGDQDTLFAEPPDDAGAAEGKAVVEVREDSEGKIRLCGAVERPVGSAEDFARVLRAFEKQRSSARTLANDASSRSHALIYFYLRFPADADVEGGPVTRCLLLADLAGSERSEDALHHSAERLAEMAAINFSLSTLQECVRKLHLSALNLSGAGASEKPAEREAAGESEGEGASKGGGEEEAGSESTQQSAARSASRPSMPSQPHTPFRRCRLTLLLRDALLGAADAKRTDRPATVQFLCLLCPLRSSRAHSFCALELAAALTSATRLKKERRALWGPSSWNAAQVQRFVREFEGGRLAALAPFFSNVSGKQMAVEWVGHIERRVVAAGGSREDALALYDAFYALRVQAEQQKQKQKQAPVSSAVARTRREARAAFAQSFFADSCVVGAEGQPPTQKDAEGAVEIDVETETKTAIEINIATLMCADS